MMFLLARLGPVIALMVGLVASLFIGSLLGSEDYQEVVLILGAIIGVAWVVSAGDRWWLPMPVGVGIGGVFFVPFKVYPHELALAACGIALLPRIFFKVRGANKSRGPLPIWFFFLLGYLLLVGTINFLAYRESGGGNIARAYMNATWGLLFGLAFYWYGSSKHLSTGLALFYVALVIRVGFGLVNIWVGTVLFVPGINFALDEQDIRFSANMLMIVAGLSAIFGRNPLPRVLNGAVAVVTMGAWLALGGSRGQLVLTIAFGIIVALAMRWRVFLISSAVGAAALALTLSTVPSIVEPLPYQLQRALTAFMWNAPEEVEVQRDVKGSGSFREALWKEGYRRWTETPSTVVFGSGIRPWDDANAATAARFEMEEFSLLVRHGADVGAYETALWSMLAVTGVVGFGLFFITFLAVFIRLVQGLRSLPAMEGPGKVFAAWGLGALGCCFFLCFVGGGFPSLEFFLAMLGLAYVEDVRAAGRRRPAEEPTATEPNEPRAARPALVPAGAAA